jgi:aconitate hydratase
MDLSAVEPMIALPFHPSEAYTIRELQQNAGDILRECEKRAANSSAARVPAGADVQAEGRHLMWIRA